MTRVIGVVSGKGGVGKSTVVANLALSLRQFGERVAVVDCNVTTPHLTHYLGSFEYTNTLNDVLRGKCSIGSATYYHHGLRIVPASTRLKDLVDLDVMKLKKSLPGLVRMADTILLDSAPGLGREALSVFDASDEILFVTTPYLAAVDDIIRSLLVLSEFNAKPKGIVLNMVKHGKHELSKDNIELFTQLPVIAEIPHDEEILRSLSVKKAAFKRKPYSKPAVAYSKLAARLVNKDYKTPRMEALYNAYSNVKNKILSIKPMVIRSNLPEEELVTMPQALETIKTEADRILKLVKTEGVMEVGSIAEKLNISKEDVKDWGRILENRGLVEYQTRFLGEDRLKPNA